MTTPEEDFERDGVVCLRGVFEPHWIETLARGVERNLAEPSPLAKRYTPDGKPGLFLGDYCSWRRIQEYGDFSATRRRRRLPGGSCGHARSICSMSMCW